MLKNLKKINKAGSTTAVKALATMPQKSFISEFFKAPVKHLKRYVEPNADNYNPHVMNVTEEGFDEDAHEWQALITENSYDLNLHQDYEYIHGNFGTVDNPILVFTVDSPWRWVICCGPMDEDEGVTHEALWFLLREGPINRCQHCGNCFKLVRLKDEFSFENDYYHPNFVPIKIDDMGEYDFIYQTLNFFRGGYWQQHPSDFETPSNYAYIMVNQDDHDRLLTDPAYRMEKAAEGHKRVEALHNSLLAVEQEWEATYGPRARQPISKGEYETMVDVEKAIKKLDRLFLRVEKFNNRAFADPDNHERRERRMLEKKRERTENNYTYYFGELTEEEQMYRDYYETDGAQEDNHLVEDKKDEFEVLQSGSFSHSNFDFVEPYVHNPEEAISDFIDQKIFKYKYRAANDDEKTYWRRQNRVVTKSLERAKNRKVPDNFSDIFESAEINEAGNSASEVHAALKPYRDWVMEEAVQQYKDYYASDAEEVASLQNISDSDKIRFAQIFEDHSRSEKKQLNYFSIPKRNYDVNLTLWERTKADFFDYKYRVFPAIQREIIRDSLEGYELEDPTKKLTEWKKTYAQIEADIKARDASKEATIKLLKAELDADHKATETDHDRKMAARRAELAAMSPKEREFEAFKTHVRRVLSVEEQETRKADLTEENLRMLFEKGWELHSGEAVSSEIQKKIDERIAKLGSEDPIMKSLVESYNRNQGLKEQ